LRLDKLGPIAYQRTNLKGVQIMIHKSIFSFIAVSFLAFASFAHDEPAPTGAPACTAPSSVASDPADIQAINDEIKNALVGFNDNLTHAEITFSRVKTNDTRAVDVQVTAKYSKTGATGSFKADIRNLEYTYPDGGCVPSVPVLKADFGMEFPLLNYFSQEQINHMGADLEKEMMNIILDVVRDFGDAAKVEAKVTRKNIDDQGNLTAVGARVKVDIDKSKLPEGFDTDKLYFTSLEVMSDISLTGAKLVFDVTINPDHRSFRGDEQGLKEYLDQIRARDPRAMQDFTDIMSFVDRFANDVVNKKDDGGEGRHHH
jgi:hypothetical protein